jgi:polyisoprenoid-binding protein YceI
MLRVAGVEREVPLDFTTQRRDKSMTFRGEVAIAMPDFGIKPPTAMLGMLKTGPNVTVQFEGLVSNP